MSAPLTWLTPQQAAQRLQVSVSTVYRWTRRGDQRGLRLVCVRTGVYGTRYRIDWIDRFMLGEQVAQEEVTAPRTAGLRLVRLR